MLSFPGVEISELKYSLAEITAGQTTRLDPLFSAWQARRLLGDLRRHYFPLSQQLVGSEVSFGSIHDRQDASFPVLSLCLSYLHYESSQHCLPLSEQVPK